MTSGGSGPFEATDACHSTWQPQEGRQPSALREPTALPTLNGTPPFSPEPHRRWEKGAAGSSRTQAKRIEFGAQTHYTKLDASLVKNYFS